MTAPKRPVEDRLIAALRARTAQVTPQSLSPAVVPGRRARRWIVPISAAAAVVALVAGVTLVAWQGDTDRKQEPANPAPSQLPTPQPSAVGPQALPLTRSIDIGNLRVSYPGTWTWHGAKSDDLVTGDGCFTVVAPTNCVLRIYNGEDKPDPVGIIVRLDLWGTRDGGAPSCPGNTDYTGRIVPGPTSETTVAGGSAQTRRFTLRCPAGSLTTQTWVVPSRQWSVAAYPLDPGTAYAGSGVFRETVSAMLASIHELPPAPTVVREYQPWAGSAPAPGLRVVHRTTGHCWESALSARSDALRCSLDQGAPGGGTLMDPCFVSPVNTHAVLCPFAEPNDKRVVRIDSDASSITSHSPTAVASQPWWIDIGHGDACGATAGATTVALGERANYGCSSGTWLWGYPDRSKPQWTIHIAADLHPKSFGSVAIRVAWF